ncbi:MAG: CcoQ/FixQ family Cbb3-type cytochrome c oxidase assembly chaperone [Ignavibacteria bacterium]|nr:CcoQ/FixQ family Cbb3-type cytochrome c oxidase assembly chaperone [Ignavibacteria bacterium]
MFKEIFEGIQGIDIYPIFSLLLFMSFFVLAAVWIVRLDKGYIEEMENLPLENSENKDN